MLTPERTDRVFRGAAVAGAIVAGVLGGASLGFFAIVISVAAGLLDHSGGMTAIEFLLGGAVIGAAGGAILARIKG